MLHIIVYFPGLTWKFSHVLFQRNGESSSATTDHCWLNHVLKLPLYRTVGLIIMLTRLICSSPRSCASPLPTPPWRGRRPPGPGPTSCPPGIRRTHRSAMFAPGKGDTSIIHRFRRRAMWAKKFCIDLCGGFETLLGSLGLLVTAPGCNYSSSLDVRVA